MEKFKVTLVIFILCLSIGYGEKICNDGNKKFSVPDEIDCSALSEMSEFNAQPQPAKDQNAKPFFWQGFPFPPSLNPIFGNNWRNWFRPPNRPTRPRPRPPSDIEECPDEGIKFISHPTNCEKYILCIDGEEMATLTCPNNMHFSRELRSCTDRRLAGCEDFEWFCPEEDTPGVIVFLPNKDDCSMYYLCWGGNEVPMSCPPGLHWSVDEEICMDPVDAQCEFGRRMSFTQITETRINCPRNGIHQLPHPDNCEQFFFCANGNGVVRTCPNNMHFSPHLNNCAPAETAGCDEWSCPANSNQISFIPNTEDCTRYYICLGGNQIERKCTNNLHWSIVKNTCMDPEKANCKFGTPVECPENGIHQIPHPNNCEKFILCAEGNGVERRCPNNMHFSPHLNICAPPETAGCDNWSCPADNSEISFIPNTEDCTRYYICLGGNQIERECSNGLHWSIANNMCMSPEKAKCPFEVPVECPEVGIHHLPHPDSCEDYFICINGNKLERSCPQNLHFSPHLKICTSPEKAGCDSWSCPADSNEVSFIPNTEDCTRYYICLRGNQIERECADNLHWSIPNNMCMNPNEANCPFGQPVECPETGVHQLPNPDSCKDYFICINGNKLERSCPPGLHFSPHLEICTSPETAGCEGWKCPADSNEISFIPNVKDCTSYFICMGGNEIKMNCAPNLHWSITENLCLPPDEANCPFGEAFSCPETGVHQLPNPNSCEDYYLCVNGNEFERSCPNNLHFSPHLGICTDPGIAGCDGWECPEDSTEVTFIPNTEDCRSYYICLFGNKMPMTCNRGQHWSITQNTCMSPNEANCPFAFSKRFSDADCPANGIVTVPNRNSCEEYYICVHGMALPRQCQPGLHFSRTLGTCVHPDVAQCVISQCPPGDIGFLPHEEDCHKYYLCFGGNQHLIRCPGDLHWSVETNSCMDPYEAGCEDFDEVIECPATGIEQIPYPDDCKQFVLCVNGLEIVLSCGQGLHFSPRTRTCMPPDEAECEDGHHIWKCPEVDAPGVIVFIPNTEDCNRYYICWGGEQIPLSCGTGLHWSIENNRCMHPDEAECPWRDDELLIEECPEEGVKAISDPNSCEHYILCINGFEVPRECPPGMHFSREIRTCVHPLVANCVISSLEVVISTTSNEDSCPDIENESEMMFMPNKKDCQSYFLCTKNESALFECAAGLAWDTDKKKCMLESKVNCNTQ